MKNITTIICFLTFFAIRAQDKKYILYPLHTQEVMAKSGYSPVVYRVGSEILKHKKEAFILKDTLHIVALSGVFETIENYDVIGGTHSQFSNKELVLRERINELEVSERHIILDTYKTLIMDSKTGQYYFVQPDFLKTFDYTSEKRRLARQEYIRSNRSLSVSKTSSIAYPTKKYRAMIKECNVLTKRLIRHDALAKKGKMTKQQVINWKRDIVAAKLLNYRISDFIEAYKKAYSSTFLSKDELLAEYNFFSKTLVVSSKGVGL